MGCVDNIDYDKFPRQGDYLGKTVQILYHYKEPNTGERIKGVIVRDDMEPPFVTIIKTEDGRFILSTECQWSLSNKPAPKICVGKKFRDIKHGLGVIFHLTAPYFEAINKAEVIFDNGYVEHYNTSSLTWVEEEELWEFKRK